MPVLDTGLIRYCVPADATAISSFAAALFPLGCPETSPADLAAYNAAELTPARFRTLIRDPNIIVLLHESDAECIIAYMVIVCRSSHPDLSAPDSAEFRKLYVDPAYHGDGIAHALMDRALSLLNAEAPRPIWLSVFSENPRAIAFYKKWGFEVVGSQEFLVGADRQKDFLMQRDSGMR
jgi:ribosomal protein S18 acetylase RimI-like enzyme